MNLLCGEAGVDCRATGAWIERPIILLRATADYPEGRLRAETCYRGAVEVQIPEAYCDTQQSMARYALGALAFSLHDLVSRESIKRAEWAKIDQSLPETERPTKRSATPRDFSTLLSVCRAFCRDYPQGVVFIGGIAVYLHHHKATGETAGTTQDADFYISLSDMGDLRECEELILCPRSRKYQFMTGGFAFDIYTERRADLIVPYEEVSAYRERMDCVNVACPEHLLVLKLDAYEDRKDSTKGNKDARDIVRIISARAAGFRPELCAPYLTDRHLELLKEIPKHQVIEEMTKGNAELALQMRLSLKSVTEQIVLATEDPEDSGAPCP